MADLQKLFRKFHDKIAIKRTDEGALLAEKRKRILDRLNDGLDRLRKAGAVIPAYRPINQGSYPMGTGIKPKDGDYDLDVALLFDLAKADHSDPVAVKKWVFDAVDGHTKSVEMKRPCVTITYSEGGEPAYHIDLAVYSESNADKNTYLAKGKLDSADEHRVWEQSDPEALVKHVQDHLGKDSEDNAQFRRCIRYYKRWRDENFDLAGNNAPRGIALTASALTHFRVKKHVDPFTNETTYNDLAAMQQLVKAMLAAFTKEFDEKTKTWVDRLKAILPVPPGNDLYERMTAGQMLTFRERLEKLRDALDGAEQEVDPRTAATALTKVFGDDFPVPEKAATATPRQPSIVTSGNSG